MTGAGGGERTVPVTVGLWPHQVEAIDELVRAAHGRVSRSDVVRRALAAYQPVRDAHDGVLPSGNGGG